MRVFIDGRRNFGFGIGRVTTNIIEGLACYGDDHEYFILSGPNKAPFPRAAKKSNFLFIEKEIPLFAREDLYELPSIIRKYKTDVFFSPQFFISPWIACPTIKMVHDLIPIVFPQWIPPLDDFQRFYGANAYEGVLEIVKQFKIDKENNPEYSKNVFVQKALSKKNTVLFEYAVAIIAYSITTADIVLSPSIHTRNEILQYFPEAASKIVVIPNPLSLDVFNLNIFVIWILFESRLKIFICSSRII